MSGDHNMHQKPRSYLDDFECPRCGHCCPQQTEQEPVAWMHNFIEHNVITHIPADIGRHPERWTPLYTAPCQTCQSLAMAVMNDQTYHEKVIPKREWVGLTLNEAEDFYEKYTDRAELINAIDKFLEEKNA